MPATARQIPITESDLAGGGQGGAYAEIEVPGDYEGVLVDVNDYDKRDKGKSYGWTFEYQVETPSGKTVPFVEYISFSDGARWKLIEVLEAHEVDLEVGLANVDPNELIGEAIGLHIDFPRDDNDEPTSKYREVRWHFALVDEPEEPAII